MKKKYLLAISLLATLAVTGCFKKNSSADNGATTYTYREFLTVSPSNWNELTYQDANDTEIMGYIGGSFFTFNYKFDANGKIVEGDYVVDFDGATDLVDVTEDYAGDPKYAVPEDATNNYAYKIVLREDLKWDDGTPIKAKDFVYTMKEQENPLFKNYRADSYYNGDTIIHNAQNYVKQGSSSKFPATTVYKGVYDEANDANMYFDSYFGDEPEGGDPSYIFTWFRGLNGSDYDDYFAPEAYGVFAIPILYGESIAAADAKAMAAALDGKSFAEIKADATLKSYWDIIIGWWQSKPNEELDFFVADYTYPELSFDEVGIKVGDKDNELIIILDKALDLLKADGSLSYKAAYQLSSLPLVKEDLYEANKIQPDTEGGLWKSKYNSSVATTASWGPYKLTSFETSKQFVLERNPNWYGYNMDSYKGQYQTDRIVCDIIPEYKTALLAFKSGDLDGIGIDVSVAQDYKNSSKALFTPSSFVGSMHFQSDAEKLEERSKKEDGTRDPEHNRTLLKYKDFRQALSLAVDRVAYNKECTTSSLPGFGIFNSMHYYDVENGGAYRNTDAAKRTICEVYGVNVDEYPSLDAAYAAVTGYNLDLARQLLESAVAAAKEAGDYVEGDTIDLVYGCSTDSEAEHRVHEFLKKSFEKLAEGTSLAGHLTVSFDASHGSKWFDDFASGLYDICVAGWTGAAWNPGYFLLAYLDPEYMYSVKWDTKSAMLTFNPYGDGQEDHTYTMSLLDWYDCLNGNEGCKIDWSSGKADAEFRCGIIAALEKEILSVYYSCPITYRFSASMYSYKVNYISTTYNTFMAYGGIRYMTFNYNDGEWEKVKGSFDYTK